MRPRKFLLVTKALTTAGLLAACKKEDMPPPPANPKGSFAYEQDAAPPPQTEPPPTTTEPPPTADVDAGKVPTPTATNVGRPKPDAGPGRASLPPIPGSAAVQPIHANTKGSHYDKALPPPKPLTK